MDALNRQVRRLLVRSGRKQVVEALANFDDLELPRRRAVAVPPSRPKNPPARRAKRPRKGPLEVVEAAQVGPEVRPVIERIALAYEAGEILPEPWRVKDFLESEGLDRDRVRSRAEPCRRSSRSWRRSRGNGWKPFSVSGEGIPRSGTSAYWRR